mgnify:FL=1
MELVNGLQKAKKLVKRLKDSDILSPDPLALEWVIELFETIEQIDTPELVEGADMAFTFTDDGEKIKA